MKNFKQKERVKLAILNSQKGISVTSHHKEGISFFSCCMTPKFPICYYYLCTQPPTETPGSRLRYITPKCALRTPSFTCPEPIGNLFDVSPQRKGCALTHPRTLVYRLCIVSISHSFQYSMPFQVANSCIKHSIRHSQPTNAQDPVLAPLFPIFLSLPF